MNLPIVDLALSRDGGADIDAALSNFGFLQMVNIGIEPGELARVFSASEAFFTGPPDVKARCAYRSAAENFGYQGLLEENLDPGAPADLKETFSMRNIVNRPPPLDRWPSARFRDIMVGFYARALASALTIQRAMAPTLGVPPDFFTRIHSGQSISLRLLYYPSIPAGSVDTRQLGAGAHTDYGFMTLLFQHEVGGLQVMDRTGAWIDVPPCADTVVVNSGDLLEQWTNGRYKSTRHRVVGNTASRARLSIAMFLDPDSDTVVEALPSCTSTDNPARFGPITAGAHLQAKLEASHKGRFAQ